MSADTINDIGEPPVWTVNGVNWHLDVPLDAYNASFDEETQAYEAASVALYVFNGEDRGLFIVMDEGEQDTLLGPTMIVYKRGTNPLKGYTPFTHEILANCGNYEDSRRMEAQLNLDLQEIEVNEVENEHAKSKIREQLDKLKNSLKRKKK